MLIDRDLLVDIVRDLSSDGLAPSTVRIQQEFPEVSGWELREQLQAAVDLGELESRVVGCRKYWRMKGSDALFPLFGDKRIIKAVEDINREKKAGATMTDVIKETNFKRTFTLDWLKRLEAGNELRSFRGKKGIIYYVRNTPEFEPLFSPDAGWNIEAPKGDGFTIYKMPPSYNPIMRSEVERAKARTAAGDEITISVLEYGQSAKTIKTTVSMKFPNLCVFGNGMSVSWGEMAMYYRRPGKALVIEL